jgi:hypothetical protein
METKELNIEVLTDEAMKLLRVGIDELYATLGGQLLSRNLPSRTAGIVSYLSAVRSASEATLLFHELPSGLSFPEWANGFNKIYEELRKDGIRFLGETKSELQKAICNEEMLRLSGEITRSSMQIIILVVGATLRMPREFDPVAVTIANLLVKIGLQNFCRQSSEAEAVVPVIEKKLKPL